jgi:diacylglycerol kinase (ATP)
MKTLVIQNPQSGRGRGSLKLDFAFAMLSESSEVQETLHSGHARELAREGVKRGFERIIACGGDGTVHEVASGILDTDDRNEIFSVWPTGSGNDYAFALGLEIPDVEKDAEAIETAFVDVGMINSGDHSAYFVNGAGLGINGCVVEESRKISFLRGMPLYSLATLLALIRRFRLPEIHVVTPDREVTQKTVALTINIGPREGSFPTNPDAKLDDGLFDVIHASEMSRCRFVRFMPKMASGTLPLDDPRIWIAQVNELHIRSEKPLSVHVDGEIFCREKDGMRDFEVKILPLRLRVQRAKSQFFSKMESI